MGSEALTVDIFRADDAEGVVKLFTEVYGDAYPARVVYDPDELVTAFEKQDNIPIVVRTPDNRVVGYSSLFRAAPDKGVYEKGNGAVLPEFRNTGVMGMIFQYVKKVIPRIEDMNMFFGEAVCNQIYIQKAASAALPMAETALEIDLMPAEVYVKEKSASGRVSALLMFMTITPKPHTVHVPSIYADQLKYIYDGLDDRRVLSPSKDDLPSLPQTRINTQLFGLAQVARMNIPEAGADFEQTFDAEEEGIVRQDVKVIQACLKLSWPWIGSIVALLREKGYFFGGVLPQWFGEDGLLMQKVMMQPNWEGIHLFSDRAAKILEFVRSDWRPSGT